MGGEEMRYAYRSRSSRFRRKRKGVNFKRLGTLITLVVFIVMIFVSVRYFTLWKALSGSDTPTLWRPQEGERTQLLLVGGQGSELISATMVSIPAHENSPVYVLRLPPEALVSQGTDTLALADIYASDGLEPTITSIEHLFGNQLPVHHYVSYDIHGIAGIIGAIDGVSVQLPTGFQSHYQDTDYVFAQGLNSIDASNLFPLLASDSSMEAAAFWAERSLLVEVFNELFSLNHISYLLTNVSGISETYDTDLASRELAHFRDTLQALDGDNTNYITLPGRWLTSQGRRLWSTEQELAQLTAQQIIRGVPPYDKEALTVDLFNANGINGFAAQVAGQLFANDFKVDQVTNALENGERTQIFYLEEFELAALELAILLEVDAELIEDSYAISDNPVAIVLGGDLVGR